MYVCVWKKLNKRFFKIFLLVGKWTLYVPLLSFRADLPKKNGRFYQ